MAKPTICPVCKSAGKIYGRPYGLLIGSPIAGENTDTDTVILVQCDSCGSVLGAYKNED
jgi:hypothetical protein